MQTEAKRTWVVILIPDKTDIKPKTVKSDKDGHCIVSDKGVNSSRYKNHQLYAPNFRAPELH